MKHLLVGFVLVASTGFLAATLPAVDETRRPARVVGPQQCAECHRREFAVWQESHHELDSQTLTRNPRTREIARALGVRRVLRDARCTSCHFTVRVEADEEKVVSGVSCESCHGPARDWLESHDDFGGPDVTLAMETPEHRAERLATCFEAGMHHPDRLVSVASECFACHTIVDRELVEVGGHPTGADFELVAWSQGEVRHNFVRGDGENPEASPQRRRGMLVVGRLVELATLLDGLRDAQGDDAFARELEERIAAARARLDGIVALVDLPEVEEVLARWQGNPVEASAGETDPSPGDVLSALAAAVRRAAEAVDARIEAADLAALDPLLPPQADYVGNARD